MSEIENPLYRAAYSRYVAEQDESVANILTLFNRPVGIGEHTDFLTEIDKWTEKGANAIDKIQFLANVFAQDEQKMITPAIPQEKVETSAQGA